MLTWDCKIPGKEGAWRGNCGRWGAPRGSTRCSESRSLHPHLAGRADTDWAGGIYPVTMTFSPDYPQQPPVCHFPPGAAGRRATRQQSLPARARMAAPPPCAPPRSAPHPRPLPLAPPPPHSAGFLHVNVFPEGVVCLSILSDDSDFGGAWKPSLGIKQVGALDRLCWGRRLLGFRGACAVRGPHPSRQLPRPRPGRCPKHCSPPRCGCTGPSGGAGAAGHALHWQPRTGLRVPPVCDAESGVQQVGGGWCACGVGQK